MTDFLDTNVLVYAFDDRDPRKQAIALTLLEGPPRSLVLSTQVLGEFFVTATRKLPRSRTTTEAARIVADFSTLRVEPVDSALVSAAISTSERDRLSYWDALVIEAAARAGCERLLTEDLSDGQTVRGVEIVNPFAE